MNKYALLVSNTFIFGIGVFLSKSINFLLLPIQTYALSQYEYGVADLVLTFNSLLIPIFSLGITESAMRFPLDSGYDKNKIFIVLLLIPVLGGILLMCAILIAKKILDFNIYGNYLIIFYFSTIYKDILMSYCKGINKNFIFSIAGAIYSFIMLIMNCAFLVYFSWGIDGYFIAIILSNLIVIVFTFIYGKLYLYVQIKTIDWKLAREMLAYSCPVLLNSVAWWGANLLNRYFIAFYLGTTASAIFAIANKIPLIPVTLIGVFQQAWQLSAIKEFASKDKNIFFGEIYKYYITLLFLMVSLVFLGIKFIAIILFQKEFYNSWEYAIILLFATIVTCISSFWGVVYTAEKKPKGAFYSTLIGALINAILNIILIPIYGINGASISIIISYLIVALYRIIYAKKSLNIDFLIKIKLISSLVLLMQAMILIQKIRYEYIYNFILFFILIYIHKKNLTLLIRKTLIYFKKI